MVVDNKKYVRQYDSGTGEVDWFIPTTNWKFRVAHADNADELEKKYTEMMKKIESP